MKILPIKRPRRYAWLSKDRETGIYFGLCHTYNKWEMSSCNVTVFAAERESFINQQDKRLTPLQQEYQRIARYHNDNIANKEKHLQQLFKTTNTKYELIKVRIGSKKCPISIDWRFIDRSPKNGEQTIPFSLRS